VCISVLKSLIFNDEIIAEGLVHTSLALLWGKVKENVHNKVCM